MSVLPYLLINHWLAAMGKILFAQEIRTESGIEMDRLFDTLRSTEGCELDLVSQLQECNGSGVPKGSFNGVPFIISFAHGKFLMLTVHQGGEWKNAIDTLFAICVEYMGAEAICQYHEDDPSRLTYEWDIVNPEDRLNKIINGGGVFAKQKIDSIILLGGRNISDYENEKIKQKNAEAETERVKNARIYGIDPGSRNVEHIKTATDWELFLEYYSITLAAWQISRNSLRDHSCGHVSNQEWESIQRGIAEMQYDIEYLIYAICKKIDIEVLDPEVDKHVSPDVRMFVKWYRYYKNHFIHTLSNEQWRAFEAKHNSGEDVSEYLPNGNWREIT